VWSAGALLQQAAIQLRASTGDYVIQDLCNLCWSATVLDLQQTVPQVLQLAAASSVLWHTAIAENLQQLYQVHLWLLDSQLPNLVRACQVCCHSSSWSSAGPAGCSS
jgi:hypothetical protein